jgi:TonB family protein
VVYHGTAPQVRSWLSFAVSGCLHGCVLAWVILGGTGQPRQQAQSIYDREIRPNEKKIVWYSLREKLPEIAPADTQPDARRTQRVPRARVKASQTMVAGARDDARPAPLIWAPEPEVAAPQTMPLPNVVAVAPPKVVRPFVAPPVKPPAQTPATALPDAPRVAADVKTAFPLPVAAPSGPLRAFTPPPNVRMQRQAMLQLPEGPQPEMVVEPNALPFPNAGPRPQPRAFVAPPAKSRAVAAVGLPAAPEVAAVSARPRSLTVAALIGRLPAMPPAAPVISAEPPAVPGVAGLQGAMAEASLAIVGLNPAKTTEVPAPPGSRAAGFSAGPEVRAEGGTGANGIALLNVPGLVVKGGAKDTQPTLVANFSPTSRENLLAAARAAPRAGLGAAPKVPVEPRAPRVAEAPDPRFAGRVVYAIAIQMPNVTSFSGSWLVWFAEREPDPKGTPGAAPQQMRPPVVVRKVDPKYIAAAAAERVEGTVRLFGVIGKDGHVGRIALLRQLDERLDRSAQEALAKWEFVAALRDGVPVDVDAIFEIPFHLAPRPKQ